MEVPVLLVFLVIAAAILAVAWAWRESQFLREVRALRASLAASDTRVAQLRRALTDRQARLLALRDQLQGLEQRLAQLVDEAPSGPGRLRLDEAGRLVEEW